MSEIQWNGNWAFGCDFYRNDLSDIQISGELCGGKCAETKGCTHFAWNRLNGGTCWLKSGSVSKNNAFSTQDQTMVCGLLETDTPTTGTRPSGTSKTVKFTYYWISFETDFPLGSDHALQSCNGGTLAYISKTYWESLKLECSGRLRTGEFVNGGNSDCTCFMKVAAPLGSKGNHLQQYVSIAANDIPYGTKVYVRQLDGIELPNKLKHNGCVRVDDVSWSFGGNHIDFYVLEKAMYEKLSPLVDGQVDITTDTNCAILNY